MTNDTLLSRMEAVKALNDAGFNVTYPSLSAWATRGGGPRFRKFGRTPLYRWGDLLDWAEGRLSPVVESTAECEARRVSA